ncbi:MAG: HypC/HybG/HupF family hydrogenase formation chaperone [Candidatus Pacearchaeota archaeon]
MCLNIPGKFVKVKKNKFIIDYNGKKREAILSVVENLKIGDYVIVSNKIIVKIIPKKEAIKYLNLINDVRK